MSILYLASSQAMSAVRCRAPDQVSCRVRTFQLATTGGLCFIEEFILYFFLRVWDNPVAAVGHPGKVEQAMFGPPFLGPSSTGGEQCGSYEGLLSHPGSCRRRMLFHSHHSGTI